ncbi:MAG: type 1 glutamine amidotransferase [Thermincola sp.]|nr:type 1 glutamine amidotransferase [Thermincola sp.]MDT3704335.1 type 1 glutamine amidotransferase [Thermincola sp.]
MRIHYLQHVPFEAPANIIKWAESHNHSITATRLYMNEQLPGLKDFDWLVVMGGPMNIYQIEEFPWLTKEKEFIRQAILANHVVLGICLGAQLIADVLGAKVYRNQHKEIGWFPITLTEVAKKSALCWDLPDSFTALHWHGDTFDLPPGALLMATSEACLNQAFLYKDRVLGLQFHLEVDQESLSSLLENCRAELVNGPFIQADRQIRSAEDSLMEIEIILWKVLDKMAAAFTGK